jgi:hypothetical protein
MAASHRKRLLDTTVRFDSQPISRFIENGDTELKRAWLQRVAQSLPVITLEEMQKMAHSYERRDGTGVVYPQTNKKNPKAPDWKGEVKIEGQLIKISGWWRQSQYGQFITLAIDTGAYNKATEKYPKEVKNDDDDSDVPF